MKIRQDIFFTVLCRIAISIIIFFICRVIFYWYNNSYFPDMAWSALAMIYYGGLRFDLSVILFLHLPYMLSQLVPFRFRVGAVYQKVTLWLHIVPISLGIVANLSDTAYYPFTLKRTTIAMFTQFENEANIGTLIMHFLIDYWYFLLLAVLLIVLTIYLTKRFTPTTNASWHPLTYFGVNTIILVLSTGLVIAGIRGGFRHSTRPITLSNASKYITRPNERAIVLNTPFTLLRIARKKPLAQATYYDSIEKQEAIFSAFKSGKQHPDSLFDKRNVVVFILESFGSEHIGSINKDIKNHPGFSPFLDSLVAHSHAFKYSFANGRKSISGMPSSLASIPSLVEPFILSHYSGNKISSLASTLRDKGYGTAFFHGAPNGSMGFDAFANQAGFEIYYGMNEYGNNDHFDGTWGIWDEEFFQYYAHKMTNMKEPFMTSLFSVSSHHPYELPKRHQGKFPKGKLEVQETIGYTDYALKRFFETAQKTSWYQNTIFVITADHSSTSGVLPEYKTPKGFFAVPIVIYDPKNPDPKPLNEAIAVQQIDIMPTILGMLNYPDDYIAFGSDMLDSTRQHIAVSYMSGNYHAFTNSNTLQFDGKQVTGYYNHLTDPLFKNNLVDAQDSISENLTQYTKAFIQEYSRRMINDQMSISE